MNQGELRGARWLYQSLIGVSAGGLTTVSSELAPRDAAWYVETGDVSHNGAVATHVAISLFDEANSVVLVGSSRQTGPGTPVAAGEPITFFRPIIVPPGWRLLGIALSLAAAETVNLRFLFRRIEV